MNLFSLRNWIRSKKEPIDNTPQGRRKKIRVEPIEGTRVLIVDDSQTVRSMMRKILNQSGYKTLEAHDGASALELATSLKPDLIFMDVMMPGINGFQATRLLRRSPQTTQIPIIMMSGNKQATESFWTTKIGANSYMLKPFTRQDLFSQVETTLYPSKVA